jgi:hypothetical protein
MASAVRPLFLMAAGPGLAQAIADLAALPPDAHERTVTEDILVHLQQRLGKTPVRTPDEEEFTLTMQGNWKHAQELGRREGQARALLTALRVRGIPVPDAARERILAEKDSDRLERWVERAVVANSLADVLDDPS